VERTGTQPEEISRVALTRYLELMPDDQEVRDELRRLGPAGTPPSVRHARPGFLWALAATGLFAGTLLVTRLIPPASATALPPPPVRVTTAPRPPKPVAPPPPPIVIRAVGDVVLGSDYPKRRLPKEADLQRITSLHDELSHADLVIGNLEGVLATGGRSRKDPSKARVYTFRMPDSYATTLRGIGFDVMSLANNHALDFGTEGLESTVKALRGAGIEPLGVPGAERAVVTVRDSRIAFLNYSWLPAFGQLDDEARIAAEIAAAKADAAIVIVTVHGGKEGESAAGLPEGDEFFLNEYRGNLGRFAHFAIDAGAHAVFGHGPHVVRPYEVYKERPIFYSLGNFIGYRSLSTKGKLAHSIVGEVRFTPKGEFLGAGVIPLRLDATGIPSVDYSVTSLDNLDGLLDEKLAKWPVLNLAAPVKEAQAPAPEALPTVVGHAVAGKPL
jgi:hypothetical protein